MQSRRWYVSVTDAAQGGVYTFEWSYQKDSGAAAGFDIAWLDDITFP